MNSKRFVKINLGSGPSGKQDWINLDWGILPLLGKMNWLTKIIIKLKLLPKNYFTTWPKNLRLVDCRKKLPFKNNSVNYIYTSHFIEHLYYYQTVELMKECHRILRSKGVLRISVPDIKLLSEKYLNGDKKFYIDLVDHATEDEGLEKIADLFVMNIYGFDSWSRPSLLNKIQRVFIRGHLWMYDFESLSYILKISGFSDIKRCNPSKGKTPDIGYLDIHKKTSLYIEAQKR